MNLAQRLVGVLAILGLAWVVLFAPRRVPIVNETIYPFLFGNSVSSNFPVVWPLAALYVGLVFVVAGMLGFLTRGRK